jgi:hypothetical protein
MTQSARAHFEGELVYPRKSADVAAASDEGQPEVLCRLAHQPFIRVAAPAAELVIEMGHGQFPAVFGRQHMKQTEENHGIDAAGNSHDNSPAATEKPPLANGSIDLFHQRVHTAMLTRRGSGARCVCF